MNSEPGTSGQRPEGGTPKQASRDLADVDEIFGEDLHVQDRVFGGAFATGLRRRVVRKFIDDDTAGW